MPDDTSALARQLLVGAIAPRVRARLGAATPIRKAAMVVDEVDPPGAVGYAIGRLRGGSVVAAKIKLVQPEVGWVVRVEAYGPGAVTVDDRIMATPW